MWTIDTQFGMILDAFLSNDVLNNNNVWENTLIVLTSDNAGSLDKRNCNYPLRDGKNTFHEGGQRVLAIIGGIIPDEQRASVLDGLRSNVDWAPSFLSFAKLIPSEYTHIKLGDDLFFWFFLFSVRLSNHFFVFLFFVVHPADDDLPMMLDGYNLYSYIKCDTKEWVGDHLVFHMKPNLKFTLE